MSVTDFVTYLPLSGVQIGIWSNDLTIAEVPQLMTSTAGICKAALPPGTYKVFAFKAFVNFDSQQPYTLTVTNSGPATLAFTGRVQVLAEPTFNKITVYGRVLKADGTQPLTDENYPYLDMSIWVSKWVSYAAGTDSSSRPSFV